MGESFGLYKMGNDEGMMPHITIANVACGFHASDPTVMANTVRLAKQHNVKVGAHPSLPDLQGFGRREMKMRPEELTDCIVYQVGALKGFLEREGMELFHIKPHGSLYGMAAKSPEVAKAVADAVKVFNVPVLGMAGTMHEKVYPAEGLEFISEYYADLEYADDGSLIITREHHAVDPKRAAQRALRAVREGKQSRSTATTCPCAPIASASIPTRPMQSRSRTPSKRRLRIILVSRQFAEGVRGWRSIRC